MTRSRLILGLAAVFAGLTAVLVVAALAVQPFLLLVALPFAATTYFLWFHATGRLAARARRREAASGHGTRVGADRATSSGTGGDSGSRFGDRFRERVGGDGSNAAGRAAGARAGSRRRRTRRGVGGRRRASSGRQGSRARTGSPNAQQHDFSRAEACRVLGVSPEADQETIKSAYREQVKQAHPDTAAGDEDSFKRINRAYERLKEE